MGSVLNYRGHWIRHGHTMGHFNVGSGCRYWITEVIELGSIVFDMFYCKYLLSENVHVAWTAHEMNTRATFRGCSHHKRRRGRDRGHNDNRQSPTSLFHSHLFCANSCSREFGLRNDNLTTISTLDLRRNWIVSLLTLDCSRKSGCLLDFLPVPLSWSSLSDATRTWMTTLRMVNHAK